MWKKLEANPEKYILNQNISVHQLDLSNNALLEAALYYEGMNHIPYPHQRVYQQQMVYHRYSMNYMLSVYYCFYLDSTLFLYRCDVLKLKQRIFGGAGIGLALSKDSPMKKAVDPV